MALPPGAVDRSVATMQATRCVETLIERPEDHGEHSIEGAMKPADRIRKRIRVLLDCSGNPGMGKLQQ
jgi:hypothetical protein